MIEHVPNSQTSDNDFEDYDNQATVRFNIVEHTCEMKALNQGSNRGNFNFGKIKTFMVAVSFKEIIFCILRYSFYFYSIQSLYAIFIGCKTFKGRNKTAKERQKIRVAIIIGR